MPLTRKPILLLLLAVLFCAPTVVGQAKVHVINVGQADSILVEFPRAALLIDAGGEDTVDGRDADHLVNYLDSFFERRSDLNRTIHAVIVSHPHIDHTRALMDVMGGFTVKNLMDGSNRRGSGIGPLRQARTFARVGLSSSVASVPPALRRRHSTDIFAWALALTLSRGQHSTKINC